MRGNDSALKAMNRTANVGGGEHFAGSSHLHPISELGNQGGTLDASRGYANDNNMIPYPQPMHVRSKMQKGSSKMRDSSSKAGGGSMVLVMSNLMTKRKNGGSKRGGKSSTKPQSDAGMGRNYHQNDFY